MKRRLLLVVSLLVCGVAAPAPLPAENTPPPEPLEQPRFLALGDSYTIGEGVTARERWPVQLTSSLRRAGVPIGVPQIVATSGWTSADLRTALEQLEPRGPFALVTLMIGVNDQVQGRSVEAYRADVRTLIARAVRLAGCDPSRVVVVSLPDWSVTPSAEGRERKKIAAKIDVFNQACHAEAAAAGARWVDVTPASRRAAGDPTLLAADRLHPSAKMYVDWAALVLPEARLALEKGRPPSCK